MAQNYERFGSRYQGRGQSQNGCPLCGSTGFRHGIEDDYISDIPEGYYGRSDSAQHQFYDQARSRQGYQGREHNLHQNSRYGNDGSWRSNGGEGNWINESGGRSMYRGNEGTPEEFGSYGGPNYGNPRQNNGGSSGPTGYGISSAYRQGGYGGGYSNPSPNTGYGQSTYGNYASHGQNHDGQSFGQGTYGPGFNQGYGQRGSYQAGSGSYGNNYGSTAYNEPIGPTYSSESSSWRNRQNRGPKGYKRSDERIREDLSDQLMHGPIDASDVEVKVTDGVVTLSGTVPSRHCKYHLEDLAERIGGVTEVKNEVRIGKSSEQETEFGGSSASSRTSSSSASSSSQANRNDRNKPAYSA